MYRHTPHIRSNPAIFFTPGNREIGLTRRGEKVYAPDTALNSHILITGGTGMGKSNIMKLLAAEASEKDDSAILVIDPHGDTAMSLMSAFPRRIMFLPLGKGNIGGSELSISMNPMHQIGLDPHVTAGLIKDAFSGNETLSQGTWGPRLELVFSSLLTTLLETDSNASLADLADVLTNQNKLRLILRNTGDSAFASYMKMQMSDWKGWLSFVSSTLNKILPVTSNPLTSSITSGREDSFSLEDVFRNRMIVIPEIWNSVLSGDASTVLSSLLIVKFWGFLLSRYGKEVLRLRVFIDEAQLIPESIIGKIMTEGRKFGFSLTLATQQLPAKSDIWSRSVLGNTGSVFLFGTSDRDAALISGSFFSGGMEKTVKDAAKGLVRGECLAWSKYGDSISGPLFIKALPFPDSPLDLETFRSEALAKYGSPGKELMESGNVDLHEELIAKFSLFMERKGIHMDTGVSVGGKIPDGVFQTGGSQILLEVEVSDLASIRRIWDKIINYKGWKKILLTPAGFGEPLLERIVDRIMNVSPMDKDLISHSLSSFLDTAVAEFDQRFRLVIPGDRMLLNIDNMQSGSILTGVRRHKYGALMEKALRLMVKSGRNLAEIRDIFDGNLNPSLQDMLPKDVCKSREFITLKEVYELCRR